MSKAVLISIRPEWCEAIAGGEKTIEVRKTRPKLPTPFKCYIYMTKQKKGEDGWLAAVCAENRCYYGAGSVIGEFVCDCIKCIPPEIFVVKEDAESVLQGSCLTPKEAKEYAGWKHGAYLSECKDLYGWRISDLVIYDTPKKLEEFLKPCPYGDVSCFLCDKSGYTPDMKIDCFNNVTRPPQSWCYVEDVQ